MRLGLEEVGEVLGEDHGDAGQVAQRGHDAAGLQLREKAGGEAGVAAEFDQAHGLLEAEVLDALADALLRDDGFGGLAVDRARRRASGTAWRPLRRLRAESRLPEKNGCGHHCLSRQSRILVPSNDLIFARDYALRRSCPRIAGNAIASGWMHIFAKRRPDARAELAGTGPARTGSLLAAAGMGLLLAFAAGCASPGPPLPPTLKLPQVVAATDLTAERVGDAVTVHWTTPKRTTDKLLIEGPVDAEVCRETVAAGAAGNIAAGATTSTVTAPCQPVVARVQVAAGAQSEAVDALPGELASGPARLLAYRVQLLNAAGKTAGASPAVFVAAGAAPGALDAFHATAAKAGVVLEWTPQARANAGESVELERVTVEPSPAAASNGPAMKSVAGSSAAVGGLLSPPKEPALVRLRADSGSTDPGSADPGGTIDRSAEIGHTYRYTAWRVRTEAVGGQTLTVRGAPSVAGPVKVEDIFPPDAPSGLVAAPGFAGDGDRARPAIDLSWEPNIEARIAGYRVYRRDADGSVHDSWHMISGAQLVTTAAYRDATVTVGRRYAYRVTAVSDVGLESAPSQPVQETAATRP